MSKVLIVDDNVDFAFGLKFAIEKQGMIAETAATLSGARKKNFNDFDLVMLDVMMPDGNGFEFCEEIRKISKVNIIFLTSCDEEIDIVRGLELGGDDYITKPFKLQELLSRIKAVMRRFEKAKTLNSDTISKEIVLRSKEIIFNPTMSNVTKNGEDISLTPVECRLLYILMSNPKKVITREVILESLWDCNSEFVEDKTLTVNMSRLRDKIEDNISNPQYIITVRGIGYKWNYELA